MICVPCQQSICLDKGFLIGDRAGRYCSAVNIAVVCQANVRETANKEHWRKSNTDFLHGELRSLGLGYLLHLDLVPKSGRPVSRKGVIEVAIYLAKLEQVYLRIGHGPNAL